MLVEKKLAFTAVLAALFQPCPAPFLAAIPEAVIMGMGSASAIIGASAAVAGDVQSSLRSKHSVKVREVKHAPRQQNLLAWQECRDQLRSAYVTISGPSPGNVLVEGIPSACMTLVTVITGEYDEGNPIPEGSDSVLFQNLSDDDIMQIEKALKAHPQV